MNKICGYSCEHNKGGVCQITNCDKKIIMTTTTEPQILTRWQDPTIEDLKKEIKKQKEVLDKIKKYIKEEKEEYEKGKLLYKEFGKELEQYTKGQLVAYNHILEILEEIE